MHLSGEETGGEHAQESLFSCLKDHYLLISSCQWQLTPQNNGCQLEEQLHFCWKGCYFPHCFGGPFPTSLSHRWLAAVQLNLVYLLHPWGFCSWLVAASFHFADTDKGWSVSNLQSLPCGVKGASDMSELLTGNWRNFGSGLGRLGIVLVAGS